MQDEKDVIGFKPKNILKFFGKDDRFEIYDYFILVRFLAYERLSFNSYFENNQLTSMNREQFLYCKGYVTQLWRIAVVLTIVTISSLLS